MTEREALELIGDALAGVLVSPDLASERDKRVYLARLVTRLALNPDEHLEQRVGELRRELKL